MGGAGVPMCPAELAGRAGKQPDGSAKTREAKLCAVWSAEGRDDKGVPVRDEGSVSYTGAIESAASRPDDRDPPAFVARVLREAGRRAFQHAPRKAILGDGAAWIWNAADEHFPGAVQIVDLFHAKQHLSDIGKAVFGAESPEARRWADARHAELDEGRFEALLAAVRVHAKTHDAARLCAEYFARGTDPREAPAVARSRARQRAAEFGAREGGKLRAPRTFTASCARAGSTRCHRCLT